MASNNFCIIVCCPSCKENYHETYIFPCSHEFCLNCTNMMKNGSATTCMTCSQICHQDDVKRKDFPQCFLPLREEDSVDMESGISFRSDDDFGIVDYKLKKGLFCEKHKKNFELYCIDCDIIICLTCVVMEHSQHNKSDDLDKIFSKSNSDIIEKISSIDDIIKNKNNLIEEKKALERNGLENYEKVQNNIEIYAKELKDQIDNIKNSLIMQINTFKTYLIKSVSSCINELNDYINLLTEMKSYYTNIIKNGSKMNIFNLKRELNKDNWIENNLTKKVEICEVAFQKPSLLKMILAELLKSFSVDAKEDLTKLKLKKSILSLCVFRNKIFTLNHEDNQINIDIYDRDTMAYKNTINFKPNSTNNIYDAFMVSTQNQVFLYYRLKFDFSTHILKLQEADTFIDIKTIKYSNNISTSFQQTLIVTTASQMLIELSEDGDEIRKITIPDAAILSMSDFFKCNQRLKDGRFLVTSYDTKTVLVSLLDSKGILIKSFTQESTGEIQTCTDDEMCILLLECDVGKIKVLSTDLQYLHEFEYPGAKQIYYDVVNNKFLLVKENEIIYFTYYLGMAL